MRKLRIAFMGAGAIAEAHSFALDSMKHFYEGEIKIHKALVASRSEGSASQFAEQNGFSESVSVDELWNRDDYDTLFILGPNNTHYEHILRAIEKENVRRVLCEKPICISKSETSKLRVACSEIDKPIYCGFQYLQTAAIREARIRLSNTDLGRPIHFSGCYLHQGYLDESYRKNKQARLVASPSGGAMADLGSHLLSLADAFLGPQLKMVSAHHGGCFPDVHPKSDLCSFAFLEEETNGAVGSIHASRVSAGARESIDFEVRYEKGAFKYSTSSPDVLQWNEGNMHWTEVYCGSDYGPFSTFPSSRVSAGWIRSLIHSDYLFLSGQGHDEFKPDIAHALRVQDLINDFADYINSK